MSTEPYVLLIATGRDPQVITETIWSLARQRAEPWRPQRVHVLTTSIGRAHVRGQLLGETVRDPRSGQPLDYLEDRWTPFCREVLDLETPIDIDVEVPETAGREISDITAPPADVAFANACYARAAALTRPGEPPVVGSVADGRKTMGLIS